MRTKTSRNTRPLSGYSSFLLHCAWIAVCLSVTSSFSLAQANQSVCEQLSGDARLQSLSIVASSMTPGQSSLAFPGQQPGVTPEYCKVVASIQPTNDSQIQVEVWLPSPGNWNGKLLGTGNGGYSSALSLPQMADALRRGYAVAGSDTGHQGDDLSFGAGHPEKIRDWAYRSTHVVAETAKHVVEVYYGRRAQHSYFSGCSTGGQQALSEAESYPDDFDGIVAGDPGYNRISLNSMFVWSWQVTHPENAAPFAVSKLPLLSRAVILACSGQNGVADGVVADPRKCHPVLTALRCGVNQQQDCLTDAELRQAEELYRGPRDASTGAQLYPGWPPGSEPGWGSYFVGKSEPARLEFWRLWVFDDPQWNPRSFQFARDRARALGKLPFVDATASDLRAFRQHGGKLLMYHGWADPVVPAEDSIDYYESVRKDLGSSPDNFMRLFLVPGMYHCGGGPGTTLFDPLDAIDHWVLSGVAPQSILAAHRTDGKQDRSMPLCPYPEKAFRIGNGNPDQASSFACVAP